MASLLVGVPPAAAQNGEVVVRGLIEGERTQLVSYRDLNLRYVAHLNILNERVESAVRRVCEFDPRAHDRLSDSYKACANAAWAGARPQMHIAYLRANQFAQSGY